MTNLYFATLEETVAVQCSSLTHWHGYTVKQIAIDGDRHSMSVAAGVLDGAKGEMYFSLKGHRFRACPHRYTKSGGQWISKDRNVIIGTTVWDKINKAPFETPMLTEWQPIIEKALAVHVKKMNGYNPVGEYLSPAVDPGKLDQIVCDLVRRRVLVI